MAAETQPPAAFTPPLIQCEIIQALEDTWTVNVFVICLDRPQSEHNIIDREFGYQFSRAIYVVREKVRAGEVDLLVICSAKDGSFMAGADIETQLKMIGSEGEYK